MEQNMLLEKNPADSLPYRLDCSGLDYTRHQGTFQQNMVPQ